MFRRSLPKDAVLWWRGDAAGTIGVVDRGRAGIRSPEGLLDVAVSGTAIGETALLGPNVQRAHDVVALDADTVVIEYTVAEIEGALEGGVPQLVLRTLVGQVGRNHLLVAAAHPGNRWVEAVAHGTLETLVAAARTTETIATWPDFMVAFRTLVHMREGSDRMRDALAPAGTWTSESALAVLEGVDRRLQAAELLAEVAAFVKADPRSR
jgi:hypothetical protein